MSLSHVLYGTFASGGGSNKVRYVQEPLRIHPHAGKSIEVLKKLHFANLSISIGLVESISVYNF